MTREEYAARVLEIAEEEPEYRLGGDGSDGTCDCVGLGIGALRRGGIAYDGLHGSNWAARYEAAELREIKTAADLRIGDNVLKAYEPADPKWALPERYGDDPDQRDYYHFGVVVSVNPLRIVHMTSPTVHTDAALGRWRYAFLWRQLNGAEEKAMYTGKVKLNESRYLNLRNGPGTDCRVIGSVPNGSMVDVLSASGDWLFVRYGAASGYVHGAYIGQVDEPQEDAEQPAEETEAYTTLIDEDGTVIVLRGRWRTAQD